MHAQELPPTYLQLITAPFACMCVCMCVCVRAFDMLSLTNAGAVPKQLINMHINQMCVIACVCVHEYTERINDLPYLLWLAAK